ncbi:MAG: NAD(P)-dependent oxidoreductase, partial [Candidatus Omnitrophica bacterium]|nr:NAD(P)-dependent oxidoreductase [Candidatus Omnitrophota bacterium]
MKILVSGANGFVGQKVVRLLAGRGHDVFVLDLKDIGLFRDSSSCKFFPVDVSVPFTFKEKVDVVIHLAAHNVTHVGDALGSIYEKVNVRGTEYMISATAPCRFVFLSTVKVYKRQAGIMDEAAPLAPVGLYEQSKLQAEDICRRLVAPKDLVILRAVNIIGSGQAEKAVVPVFFKKAFRHEPIEIFGPRRQCLQLLDVEDAAQAL